MIRSTAWISSPVRPTARLARSVITLPCSISAADTSTMARILAAASSLRCASERTSCATTEKPRLALPARAASTEALSDSSLVWKATASTSPTMWTISRLLTCSDCMLSRRPSIALRLRWASVRIVRTCSAASSTWCAHASIAPEKRCARSTTLDSASRTSPVRPDRPVLPTATSREAWVTAATPCWTASNSDEMLAFARPSVLSAWPISSRPQPRGRALRSPWPMRSR